MKKVLIVDDEKSFLLSLQDGLQMHADKFSIVTANNGLEAVKLLEESVFDLLITDLEMPEMNGFELLAWVTQKVPQLPVIVMTAFGTPEIESRLAEFEALQYLEKPLDLYTLEKAILTGLNNVSKSFIRGISPATFLQLLYMEKKSCSLKIKSPQQVGYLYLQSGNLIDAECGELKGEEAAYQIVCWDKTEIEMENFCQRQETIINGSLESILLNASQQKDEQQDKLRHDALPSSKVDDQDFILPDLLDLESADENSPSAKPNLHKKEIRSQLIASLNTSESISEFALFDQHSQICMHNNGKCSLHSFDPAIYLHLLAPLDEKLGFGINRWISFFNTRRTPFILFKLDEYSLLVKLQPGSRAQPIAQELIYTMNNLAF